MRASRRSFVAAAAALALLPSWPAPADDKDRARDAATSGRILPLAAIVERATSQFGGTVLDVEYEDEDDAGERAGQGSRDPGIYQVKLLTADGRVLKLDYDARTGELIRERGRVRERRRERRGYGEGE